MYNLGYKINWNGTYYQFTVLMVFVNCTVNPFIYLIKYRDYQQSLRKFLGRDKKKSHEEMDTKSSNVSMSRESGDIFTLAASGTPYPTPNR